MKKIFSVNYSGSSFSLAMLVLRLSFGGLMLINHGLPKLMKFATLQNDFYNFIGLGSRISLILCLFAEILCSLFLLMGLFTRLVAVLLIFNMLVVIFGASAGKPFLQSEMALLFLAAYITLLFCGPGKISIDKMINK